MRHMLKTPSHTAQRIKPTSSLRLFAALLMLAAALLPALSSAKANDDSQLSDVILSHFKKLIVVFNTIEDPNQQRREVGTVIDFAAITRGVIGKHRQSMDDTQQGNFQTEFEQSITKLLAVALQGGEDYEVAIERIRRSSNNPDRAQVLGVISTPGQERFELLTTTARTGDTWLLRNLTVNGINLGITYRSQFNELVIKHSGDFDAVITAWAASLADTENS